MSFSIRSLSMGIQRGFASLIHSYAMPKNRMVGRDSIADYLFKYPEHRKIPTIITPYHWPDVDGIACAEGMRRLLERTGYAQVRSMISQTPQLEAQLVMNKLGITIPQFKASSQDQIICVDVSDSMDLPPELPRDQIKIVIDHRSNFDVGHMPNALAWIRPVGAAATMVAGLYRVNGLTPEPDIAKLLHAAIMSNTVCCKTRNTTVHDTRMAQWTGQAGNVGSSFVLDIFKEKSSLDHTDLLTHLDADLSSKNAAIAGKQVAVAQLEIVDVEKLLNARNDELLQALDSLKLSRNAESILLIAVDIRSHQTFFIFRDDFMQKLVSEKFSLRSHKQHHFYCEQVITRKDLISSMKIY